MKIRTIRKVVVVCPYCDNREEIDNHYIIGQAVCDCGKEFVFNIYENTNVIITFE